MTNHAVGFGTCMTIPSYLPSEMHVGIFPDQTTFQSWIVNFRAEVCAKARNERKGAKKSYNERKTEECFHWETSGSCSKRDACSFLDMHATEALRTT